MKTAKKNIQDLTFSLVRYDRMRRDSNLLYKPRVRTVSSSSSNNCSRRSSVICNTFDLEELEEVLVTFDEQMVNKEVAFGDLTAAQVVENEVEVVERLKAWQDQLANTRSPDPFVGLPVDEQSPVRSTTRALDSDETFFCQKVGRGHVERTDPYHGLQWETRQSWQVESWEGSLDSEGRCCGSLNILEHL